MSEVIIAQASSAEHIGAARALFTEYEREINVDLCFQGFADELRDLPGKYAPPDGTLLLAFEAQHAVACVAMRRLTDNIAELKRLYIQPAYRHLGLGRKLTQQIISAASVAGYAEMVLDTLSHMNAAQALYRSLGFVQTQAYYNNPLPGVLYFHKQL